MLLFHSSFPALGEGLCRPPCHLPSLGEEWQVPPKPRLLQPPHPGKSCRLQQLLSATAGGEAKPGLPSPCLSPSRNAVPVAAGTMQKQMVWARSPDVPRSCPGAVSRIACRFSGRNASEDPGEGLQWGKSVLLRWLQPCCGMAEDQTPPLKAPLGLLLPRNVP